MRIPFDRPCIVGNELNYVRAALEGHQIGSDGPFTARCQNWIAERLGVPTVLLTNSGTSSLDIAAILSGVGPGDEVIMPAFTAAACASAVAGRGATPVFADVRPDTLNIDPAQIAAALTPRTKAILAVHYAGIPCDIEAILKLASERGLLVIEDAAQAFLSSSGGRPAGTRGHIGVFSFNYHKNIVSGEGGAILINEPSLARRAEEVRQRGTNRMAMLRGEAKLYEWTDLGSNYAPSDITAAVLLAQIERAPEITAARRAIWARYHSEFAPLEQAGRVQRPTVPAGVVHNAHIYFLLLPAIEKRDDFIAKMKARGIATPFHFTPLDTSPAGRRFGRAHGSLPVTHSIANRLVRLPLWYGMIDESERVIEAVIAELR